MLEAESRDPAIKYPGRESNVLFLHELFLIFRGDKGKTEGGEGLNSISKK